MILIMYQELHGVTENFKGVEFWSVPRGSKKFWSVPGVSGVFQEVSEHSTGVPGFQGIP